MNYINTINNVAVKEIKNAHVSATLFHGMMAVNSQKWNLIFNFYSFNHILAIKLRTYYIF